MRIVERNLLQGKIVFQAADGNQRKTWRSDSWCIDKDHAFRPALGKDLQPLPDEVPVPVMTGNEIEIITFKQQAFNPIENRRVVAFSQVRGENAHHVASL